MKDRCENEKNFSYPVYGGKGISVCPEWRAGYQAFKEWAYANGYVEGLTIDRINVDDDYKPSNCRFVTKSENNKEMLDRNYQNGTGQFTEEVIANLTEKNRDNLGCNFEMMLDGKVVKEYRCLIECAEDIVKEKSLKTAPVQIKKNISACLNGKRKKCHGYTFRRK
ncbi:hypothetical protein vBPpSSYP_170 [Pseudomonas phage vB_PpS_SYP]|nr:hypothetical protein vBPpSSYP_170 [Pseudomonas phage vB_PpS_SYP]